MARIYRIKRVPASVREWFNREFPGSEYTFNFYWYTGRSGKIYGCEVYKNGEYHHMATQATQEWFEAHLA